MNGLTGWEYLGVIFAGLLFAGIAVVGLIWVVSLARQGVRETRAWLVEQRQKYAAGHLLRQIRQGKLGL